MKGVIYCYHCIPTGKKYIGQTINEKYRKQSHISKANTDCDFLFYRAVRKYGWENFIYGIIDSFEESLLNEKEIYFIEEYDTFNNGYNTTVGGGGCRGRIRTEEELKKFSAKMKGRKKTEEHRLKISKAHLLLNKKGIPLSKTHKENMKLAIKNKRFGKNNNFYGKTHSIELKEKWSKERKNVPFWNNGHINKRCIECPGDGWVRGALSKGSWWNNGLEENLCLKCPGEDWKRGKIKNKIYIFISPQGDELEVKNLSSFSKKYNLKYAIILKLIRNKKDYDFHNGWKFKKYYIEH
jgi:group I intron endonuclease